MLLVFPVINKPKRKVMYSHTLVNSRMYDMYTFFGHDGNVYRKASEASDLYRVDEGEESCLCCVKGKDYAWSPSYL